MTRKVARPGRIQPRHPLSLPAQRGLSPQIPNWHRMMAPGRPCPAPGPMATDLHQLFVQFDLLLPEAFVFQVDGFQLSLEGIHLADLSRGLISF